MGLLNFCIGQSQCKRAKPFAKLLHSLKMNGSPVIFFKNYCRALKRRGLFRQKNEFVMRAFHFAKLNHFSASFIWKNLVNIIDKFLVIKRHLFKHKKLKDRWKKNLFFCNLTNILQFIKSNKKNLQKIKNYYWRFKEVKVQYY